MGYVSGKVINLTAKLNPADTTLKANIDVGIGVGRLYFINDAQEEWLSYTSVTASGSDFIYGGLTRGLSQTADPATAGTGKTWLAGSIGTVVAMHDQLFDRQKPEATVFATATARDTALGADGFATKNWVNIYVTATGLHYNYNLSTNQWESVSTGTTTPNATQTVAGKVELPTNAEFTAGTDIGGTGASLTPTPSQLQKSINLQSVALTTSAETDLYSFEDTTDSKNKKITKANLRNDLASSTTLKGTVELAIDSEVTTGTDTSRYMTIKQSVDLLPGHYFEPIAGTTYTLGTSASSVSILSGETTYSKRKEISIPYNGTYTISWDSLDANDGDVYMKIYKNGTAFGTEKINSTNGVQSDTDTLTFGAGDLIQLYARRSAGANPMNVSNFVVKCAVQWKNNGIFNGTVIL